MFLNLKVSRNAMKYKFICLMLMMFFVSGCITGGSTIHKSNPEVYNSSSSSKYIAYTLFSDDDLSGLDGWQMDYKTKSFFELDIDIAKTLASQGVKDVAHWKLSNGNESIYIWIKFLDTQDNMDHAIKRAANFMHWHDFAYIDLGVGGQVGFYENEYNPRVLMLAYSEDLMLVQISYTNSGNTYEEANTTMADKAKLVKIGKKILENYKESSISSVPSASYETFSKIEI